jgi:hypothetical protein
MDPEEFFLLFLAGLFAALAVVALIKSVDKQNKNL